MAITISVVVLQVSCPLGPIYSPCPWISVLVLEP